MKLLTKGEIVVRENPTQDVFHITCEGCLIYGLQTLSFLLSAICDYSKCNQASSSVFSLVTRLNQHVLFGKD